MKLKKPSATLPLLPIPIVPEHVWKNVSEKEVKTYSAAPTNGKPVVGSGPFRLVQGQGDGSTFKFEKNPDYWGGTPHIDEVIFQFYKNDDSAVQALIKGEVDFVEDITALEVKSLAGQGRDHRPQRQLARLRRDRLQLRLGRRQTGNPIGNPNPAVLDPKFRHALGYALDLPTLIKKVYQGAGLPGTTIIPPAYKEYHWEPPAGPEVHLRPGQGGAAARRRRLHEGLRRHPHPAGRQADRHAAAGGALGLPDLAAHHGLLQAVARRPRASSRRSRPTAPSQLTDVILKGNFDAFQWGWFVEPDPDSMLSYLTTCDQFGGWSDSWYSNKQYDQLYKRAAHRDRPRQAGGRRQEDAGDPLPRLALPGDGVLLDR